jgi:hypothetical protein
MVDSKLVMGKVVLKVSGDKTMPIYHCLFFSSGGQITLALHRMITQPPNDKFHPLASCT